MKKENRVTKLSELTIFYYRVGQ